MFTIRKKAFVGVALVAAMLTGWSVPASAETNGVAKSDGFIVTSGESGTREVLTSHIRVRGAFKGVGTIEETENQPGDPENVSRDDLVFAEGTMHLVSETLKVTGDIDPNSCVGTFNLDQKATIEGGTGLFANASGTGTGHVTAYAIAQRAADGSCDQEQPARFEVDVVSGTIALSY